MSSPFSPEDFAQAQKAQIESLLTLANTAFAGMERLAALNLNTARSVLEDSATSTQALLAAKDFQSFIALQGSLVQPAVDQAVLWSRSACEISSATREELGKTMEASLTEASETLDSTLDALVKNAPAGTDAAVSASVNALKSAIGSANTAYSTFNQVAKQVSAYAESQFPAARKPAAKTRKAA